MKRSAVILLLFFFPFTSIHAIYDPLSVPNNQYGIHIADTNDIPDVAPLVNSSNGDWGYVTLVIQDTDRDIGKWQGIFDRMRRLHLVPLVRLATHPEGSSWAKPSKEDAVSWVEFLSNLNWPIENRYIILFNEPNHAMEWGNTINPEEYADVVLNFVKAFETSSEDYFMLPAGLDGSASSNSDSLEESIYIRRMYEAKPDVFSLLDGWTSHSYPNPGFSGSPYASGNGTIRGYEWELNFLRQLGVQKTLPVFITETGWEHSEGKYFNNRLLRPKTVGENIKIASEALWTDQRIVAITPFVFNYQDIPFDHFSWKKLESKEYYEPYYAYVSIPKINGEPKQRDIFSLTSSVLPDSLVADSSYVLEGSVENSGQSILDETDEFTLMVQDSAQSFTYFIDPLPIIEPQEKSPITIRLKTPAKEGVYDLSLKLIHRKKAIILESKRITIVPPPQAIIRTQLGWKKVSNAQDATILVYDNRDTILHTFQDIPIEDGVIRVSNLTSIVPGKPYRIVVLVPSYLPRQAIVTLKAESTEFTIKRFYPFDIDTDGSLTFQDLIHLLHKRPRDIVKLFF